MSDNSKADVCIVGGAGHVGLPMALSFANAGSRVQIYDINRKTLDIIASGKMPFVDGHLIVSRSTLYPGTTDRLPPISRRLAAKARAISQTPPPSSRHDVQGGQRRHPCLTQ